MSLLGSRGAGGADRGEPRTPVAVSVGVVRVLRAELLRPGQAPEELVYPGDEANDTLHAAVLENGTPVAISSVMREPFPPRGAPGHWRLRGMATRPGARGRGLGSALLGACVEHARAGHGTLLWCNARVPARRFYERAGLRVCGEAFEIRGIGPHLLMLREL